MPSKSSGAVCLKSHSSHSTRTWEAEPRAGTSCGVYSAFGQTRDESITQTRPTALNSLCAVPLHASLPAFPPAAPATLTVWTDLSFPEGQRVGIAQHAAFSDGLLSHVRFRFPQVFSRLDSAAFSLVPDTTPLHDHSLFIRHLLGPCYLQVSANADMAAINRHVQRPSQHTVF